MIIMIIKLIWISFFFTAALACGYQAVRQLPEASAFAFAFGAFACGLWGALLVRKLFWETGETGPWKS